MGFNGLDSSLEPKSIGCFSLWHSAKLRRLSCSLGSGSSSESESEPAASPGPSPPSVGSASATSESSAAEAERGAAGGRGGGFWGVLGLSSWLLPEGAGAGSDGKSRHMGNRGTEAFVTVTRICLSPNCCSLLLFVAPLLFCCPLILAAVFSFLRFGIVVVVVVVAVWLLWFLWWSSLSLWLSSLSVVAGAVDASVVVFARCGCLFVPLHPRFLNSVYCYPSVEGEAVPLPFGLEDVAGIPSPKNALNVRSPLALKITAGFEGLFGTVMLDSGLVFFFLAKGLSATLWLACKVWVRRGVKWQNFQHYVQQEQAQGFESSQISGLVFGPVLLRLATSARRGLAFGGSPWPSTSHRTPAVLSRI